jgi:hypothetical protein
LRTIRGALADTTDCLGKCDVYHTFEDSKSVPTSGAPNFIRQGKLSRL